MTTEYHFGRSWPDNAEAYQDYILPLVSRTFALTIPQLPPALARVVGNAYLLCRIADTVEDDPAFDAPRKKLLEQTLIEVVAGRAAPEPWAAEVAPLLSSTSAGAERDLIRQLPLVIAVTRSFGPVQREVISRCVAIMGRGMHRFQQRAGLDGLHDQAEMDDYCYFVAGVVGEMLTELFCAHAADIADHAPILRRHAVSFGQGLQMVNILKDRWEDRARGACWLPRETFARHGVDVKALGEGVRSAGYFAAQRELVGVAHAHLRNALTYTLAIPSAHTGIRRFCAWAIGLALLTLRNIHRKPDFAAGAEVKVSRRALATAIMLTNMAVHSEAALRWLFEWIAGELPLAPLSARWSDETEATLAASGRTAATL
ncbi:MAG: squalene/phytoene synthase family protein [Gammaproteobacteria bacterium]|nr:squalene/phytoene synthase family protein [Gammaproteobacteria bacterium]